MQNKKKKHLIKLTQIKPIKKHKKEHKKKEDTNNNNKNVNIDSTMIDNNNQNNNNNNRNANIDITNNHNANIDITMIDNKHTLIDSHNEIINDERNPFSHYNDSNNYHTTYDSKIHYVNLVRDGNKIDLKEFIPENMELNHIEPYITALQNECKIAFVNREALVIADYDYENKELSVSLLLLFEFFYFCVYFFFQKTRKIAILFFEKKTRKIAKTCPQK